MARTRRLGAPSSDSSWSTRRTPRRPGRRRSCAARSSAPGRSARRRCGSRARDPAASGWRPRRGRVLGDRLHEPCGEATASAVRGGRHCDMYRPSPSVCVQLTWLPRSFLRYVVGSSQPCSDSTRPASAIWCGRKRRLRGPHSYVRAVASSSDEAPSRVATQCTVESSSRPNGDSNPSTRVATRSSRCSVSGFSANAVRASSTAPGASSSVLSGASPPRRNQ